MDPSPATAEERTPAWSPLGARRWRIGLRQAIAFPVIAVLVLTLVLQASLQARSIQQLLDDESAQLLRGRTATVMARLDFYTAAPVYAQKALAELVLRQGALSTLDPEPFSASMLGLARKHFGQEQHLSVFSVGTIRGDYIGFRRNAAADFDLMIRDARQEPGLRIYKGAEASVLATTVPAYDPRVRPWYLPPAQRRAPVWSELYVNQDERQDLAMSYCGPIEVKGQLLGVAAIDLSLQGLNAQLRAELGAFGGLLLIIDSQGRLVAHSEPGPVVMSALQAEQPLQRQRLEDHVNPLVRAIAPWVAARAAAQEADFRLEHLGDTYHGRVMQFSRPAGLEWRVVALLPEAALLGHIRRTQYASVLMSMLLGAAGLALIVWVVGGVTRPLLQAALAAEQPTLTAVKDLTAQHTLVREPAVLLRAMSGMADRLQESFATLRRQALVDEMTGLATRRGLLDEAGEWMPQSCALVLVGLDDFRSINDILGYASGDQILRLIAQRLQAHCPPSTLVARVGGDEFAVLLRSQRPGDDLYAVGRDILSALDEPLEMRGEALSVRASAGAVGGTLQPGQLPEWLRQASMALGQAKSHHRLDCVVYSDDLLTASTARTRLVNELRKAVARQEFVAHYQPIVSLTSGEVVAVETLVRWQHPERGLLAPAHFLEVAEESDLIVRLGEHMLRQACLDARQLFERRGIWLDVHVNVSARQLLQSNFVAMVMGVLDHTGMPAQHLTLELTESLFIGGAETSTGPLLESLKQAGIRISIDDFGTGYSSLSYLERLPLDGLKVDRSFVQLLDTPSHRGAGLAAVIIDVAHKLSLETVAEGVETPTQVQALRAMSCERAQGFLFGHPAPMFALDLGRRDLA
ncbi:EAL domain-containing protein [Ideonella paludis]|uniref:EAL domain-containing protein n=1 Tax=Ideonella paludis TaxID=1233411 RepID=A0ABS5DZL1_9BURK|nr:EAL domain-containing protein [Ideonella paludis]